MFSIRRNISTQGRRALRKFSRVPAKHIIPRSIAPLAIGAGGAMFMYFWNQSQSANVIVEAEDNIHTVEIGSTHDFLDGQLREIKVGETDEDTIIVVRLDGKLYACGSKCSHFGAPLSKGMLFEDRIYCPFHLASFSVITGYPDNGPMLDGIPTYKISEDGNGKITVEVPKKLSMKQPIKTVTRDPNNNQRYVIIGGGIAGSSAAETLRQSGFTGEIVILSKEEHLPYDRTILTKNIAEVKVGNITFRDQAYWDRLGVEVRTSTTVTGVDSHAKTIQFSKGGQITYDKLLVATGCSPRVPPITGANLENTFILRDYNDAQKIRDIAKDAKKVVILGSGFIGVEVAANLRMQFPNAEINVVSMSSEAFDTTLGPEVGSALRILAEQNGVKFNFDQGVHSLEGTDGKVTSVKLQNGKSLDADLVIMGIGATPATWFLKDTVALDKDGGVNTDVFLRSTSNKDVFAAGDIASYPYFYTAERVRVEHISEAIGQGAHAALNMVGKMQPYAGVPFFWTRAFNKSLACVGVINGYDKV